jgi:hypothetical protein
MRDGWDPNALMKSFVEVVRMFYKIPNKAVDSQCGQAVGSELVQE